MSDLDIVLVGIILALAYALRNVQRARLRERDAFRRLQGEEARDVDGLVELMIRRSANSPKPDSHLHN